MTPETTDLQKALMAIARKEGPLDWADRVRLGEAIGAIARSGTRPAAEPIAGQIEEWQAKAADYDRLADIARNRRHVLEEIAGSRPLTATPQQFADHLQRLAKMACDDYTFSGDDAEPSQSGSAGEARPIAYPDADLSCGLSYDGMLVCGSSDAIRRVRNWLHMTTDVVPVLRAELEEARAALSRQAPAAPAAVDFEQWWLAEVAANGGVPIGADYKHWAKKGFELRGDARAPVAPVERTYELGQKHEREAWLAATGWDSTPRSLTGALPNAFYKVFGDGVVPTSRDQKMWLAGYYAASTPSSPTQALLGWTRYEKARKLNVAQWAELHQRNLRGENFDDMIDALPATTMTQQEGWTYDKNGSGKWEPVQQDLPEQIQQREEINGRRSPL